MDKQRLREQVWDDLEASGEARFPFPPHGRIPNFAGAEAAAGRLADTGAFREADVIKINPDSPQRPVRKRALAAGKILYMAVPRLAEEACFLELDPARIDDIDHATTIGGAEDCGVQVVPDDVAPIDLVVSGSVAVSEAGDRIGKGEGYSDLEYALLLGDAGGDDGPRAATLRGVAGDRRPRRGAGRGGDTRADHPGRGRVQTRGAGLGPALRGAYRGDTGVGAVSAMSEKHRMMGEVVTENDNIGVRAVGGGVRPWGRADAGGGE